MKKTLILAAAAMLLASCGNNNATSNLKDVYSDAALNEIVAYLKQAQPGIDEATIKSQFNDMAVFIKAADNLKLDISEELEEAKENNGGEKGIKEAKDSGYPESYINFILNYQACNDALDEYMDEHDLYEDANEKEFFMNNYWRAKHVLVSTEGMNDSEKAEAKKKAEDIYARAKKGEDFDALVAEYSEDPGSKSQPDGYVFTTKEMVPEFEDGTKNIAIGEFNMVETSYGYHIIKRLAIDETPELYEQFYKQSNIENSIKSKALVEFAEENAK